MRSIKAPRDRISIDLGARANLEASNDAQQHNVNLPIGKRVPRTHAVSQAVAENGQIGILQPPLGAEVERVAVYLGI